MTKHFAANVPNATSAGNWDPKDFVPGFDLADVSSVSKLNGMPDGVMGLVYTGNRFMGKLNDFKTEVERWRNNKKVWGFYLIDEPYPEGTSSKPATPPAQIKEQADYLHSIWPGIMVYVKFTNLGSPENPTWKPYTLQNTGLDVFGVGGYAVRGRFTNGYDKGLIKRYVESAIRDGIPREKISPCMQCFGGTTDFPTPTRSQMDEMFAAWREYCPDPIFDMAYSWGIQTTWMTQALSNNAMMREELNRHFALQLARPTELRVHVSVDDKEIGTAQVKQGSNVRLRFE